MLWWTFKIHFPEISSMWNFIYICVLKQMCSCMVNILIRAIMAVLPENLTLSGDALGAIIRAAADGRISRQSAREVFAYAFDGGEDVEGYIKRHGLEMVSDDAAYERVLGEVLAACEKDVAAYRAGNEKVFGFLVGQAMKALRGKADPKKISEMLGKML